MRAQCECARRHRVTSAQCCRQLQCPCGKRFEVPSLRQLRIQAAENVIIEIFDDPEFWATTGCFICGQSTQQTFLVDVQLQPRIYATVVVGPERRSVPILQVIFGSFFGIFGKFAVAAVDDATQKRERVLVQEADGIQFSVRTCNSCAEQENHRTRIVEKLWAHKLFIEMREDYRDIRIAQIASESEAESANG